MLYVLNFRNVEMSFDNFFDCKTSQKVSYSDADHGPKNVLKILTLII